MSQRVHIAFHSLFAQNALKPSHDRLGGAEKRSTLFATMLAEEGIPTGILMANPGCLGRLRQTKSGIVPLYHPKYRLRSQGIQIQKPVFRSSLTAKLQDKIRSSAGLPIINTPKKAKKAAFAPFYKAGARLWVGLSLNDSMLELAEFCRSANVPFLLGLAHDIDLDFFSAPKGRDIYGASREKKRKTMELASAVLVQNRFQEQTLRQYFPAKPIFALPNPIVVPNVFREAPIRSGALWIGKMDSNKNPKALLRLAAKLPQLTISMVANPAELELEQEVLQNLPPNIQVISSLPYEETQALMAKAQVHLSTSFQEGFPNTFLEAAVAKTPTVSLHVDPDGRMKEGLFGFCANGDEDLFAEQVFLAHQRSQQVESMMDTSWNYVKEIHAYERIKKGWIEIVKTLI
jgi:glycosyltransferase involved in cell wall biosynthesis